jgi:hypothetical protein
MPGRSDSCQAAHHVDSFLELQAAGGQQKGQQRETGQQNRHQGTYGENLAVYQHSAIS